MLRPTFKIESAPDISLEPLKYKEYDLTPHLVPYVSLLFSMLYNSFSDSDLYPLAVTGRFMSLDKCYENRELKNFRALVWSGLFRSTWGDALKIVPDVNISSEMYTTIIEPASYKMNPTEEIQRAAYELTYECLEHTKSIVDILNYMYMTMGKSLDDIEKAFKLFKKSDKLEYDLNALVFNCIIWNSILERFNNIYETNKHRVFKGDTKRIYGGFYFDKYRIKLDDIIERFGVNVKSLLDGSKSVQEYYKENEKNIIVESVFTLHCKYLLADTDAASTENDASGDKLQGFSEMMLASKLCDPLLVYSDIAMKQFVLSTKVDGMSVFELPDKMLKLRTDLRKANGDVRSYQKECDSLHKKLERLERNIEKHKCDIAERDEAIKNLKKSNINPKVYEKLQSELKDVKDKLADETALRKDTENSLSELRKENARLIKEMRTFDKYKKLIEEMKSDEEEKATSTTEQVENEMSLSDCVDTLNNFRIGIVNNQPNHKAKIEQMGLKAYVIDQENNPNIFKKHDMLVVCTRFTGHPTAIRAQKEANKNGAFIINYNGTSVDDMVREVVKQLE